MYGTISNFLTDFSEYSRPLWALFVFGVVATLSLGLYAFWEAAFGLVKSARTRRPGSRTDHAQQG